MRKRITATVLAVLTVLLCGCGTSVPSVSSIADSLPSLPSTQSETKQGTYVSPPFRDAVFHEEAAEGTASIKLDFSCLSEGYVAVSAVSSNRLKFQVICGSETYNYNIASDGTPSVFPINCGNGSYRFRVMENVSGNKYAEQYSATKSVTLSDEFQPFLRPSDYVPYNENSRCVRKAAELAAGVDTEIELVAAVYAYICRTVRYDTQKAETVTSGYLPNPDETMATGKGICFDYAALAASMLRSQGIPTKEIFGYVSPDGLYHAWNMFYTAESGWVTVSFETRKDDWNRMDMTFAANGANNKFIGDGSNYSDLYWY